MSTVAAAELRWVTDAIFDSGDRLGPIAPTDLGRANGLTFSTAADRTDLADVVAQLSCALVLFTRSADGGPMLAPVPLTERLAYGTELVTTQRYRGKTNERLTRAMLNLALSAAGIPIAGPWSDPPTVLDPMCGRGTTLNWALAYGANAIGIEPDAAALKHHQTFLTTWAKQQRLPHKHQGFRAGNAENRSSVIDVFSTRRDQKAGRGQRIETFCADGGDPGLRIRAGSVDVIVADLPYGVQHRGRNHALDPTDTVNLVARVAPAWSRWLRPGGSVCLAWNTRRASRIELLTALVDAGFDAPDGSVGDGCDPEARPSMAHRVDSSITRDVVVVTAPGRRVTGRGG